MVKFNNKKVIENILKSEIDGEFRKNLEAIVAADGDMDAAFASIKETTGYRTAFLFKKSMNAKIAKFQVSGLKDLKSVLESDCPDKNIAKSLEILGENGLKYIEQLDGVSKKSLKEIKGLGDKKIEAIAEFVSSAYGVNMVD